MAININYVRAAICRADDDAIVALFEGASEKERRAVAQEVRKIRRTTFPFVENQGWAFSDSPSRDTANLAVLATSAVSSIPDDIWIRPGNEAALRILLQRPRKWIESYVSQELRRRIPDHTALIKELMRRGYCHPIDNDEFILGTFRRVSFQRFRDRDDPRTITDILKEEDDLLDDIFWRFFEVSETHGRGIGTLDREPSAESASSWKETLYQLSREGRLPRGRLMQCCLEALCRGFDQADARWFAGFYEGFDPTAEEMEDAADFFFRHLRSENPVIAQFGIKRIEQIEKTRKKDKRGPLPAESYFEAIPYLLRHTTKTMIKKALRFVKGLKARFPDEGPRLAEIVSALLVNDAPDIQTMAFDLIESLVPAPDVSLREKLAVYRDTTAPSLRLRFDAYVLADEQTRETASASPADFVAVHALAAEVPESESHAFGIPDLLAALDEERPALHPVEPSTLLSLPRCVPETAIRPIESIDELIDTALSWVESPDDFAETDRILDGLVRFSNTVDEPEFERRVAPLTTRIRQPVQSLSYAAHAQAALLGLWVRGFHTVVQFPPQLYVDYWGAEKNPLWGNQAYELQWQFYKHIARHLVSRKPFAVLSTATHQGAWLDPRALADRWIAARDAGVAIIPADLLRALLRLAPDGRARALERLDAAAPAQLTEMESAIRYALGADAVEIGSDIALWAAAGRARGSNEDGVLPAPEENTLRRECRFAAWIDRLDGHKIGITGIHDEVQLDVQYDVPLGEYDIWPQFVPVENPRIPSLYDTLSFWPSGWDAFCLYATGSLALNANWWEARWQNRTLLEPLLDPDYPLTLPAALLLSVGLGCKEPGEHGLATDIAIAAIDDGRLTTENLGPALKIVFGSKGIAPSRWAKTLRDVAGVSTLHAYVVFESMVASLPESKDALPKNPAAYFELMNELSAELGLGIRDDAVREMLEEFKGPSKAAKLAKSLLSARTALSEEARRRLSSGRLRGE